MITFHVIYTPGTTIGLSRFAPTLLQEPNCQLRLVSNGCTAAEDAHLTKLCASNERFEFIKLPTDRDFPWPHPNALNYLQAACDEKYFAIIDSDIFATGPFLPTTISAELTCCLPNAVFWNQKDERFQLRRQQMGCTYFAIYDNAAISHIRKNSEVGFDKFRWDLMTTEQHQLLQSADYVKRYYDTAKVLNTQLFANGGQLVYIAADNLRHLGGVSRAHHRQSSFSKLINQFVRLRILPSPNVLWTRTRRRERKIRSGIYFSELLDGLASGGLLPKLPRMGSRYVTKKMREISAEIIDLHKPASSDHV